MCPKDPPTGGTIEIDIKIIIKCFFIILSVFNGLVDSIAVTGNPVSVDDDVRTNFISNIAP